MFTAIWTKIVGLMGLVITGLLFVLKYRGNKIDELEEKNEYLEVEKEITVKQDGAKKEILQDEKVRIKKKLLKKSKKSKRDRLNSL